MIRYRTRPREVTAVQWFKNVDHPAVRKSKFNDGYDILHLNDAWNSPVQEVYHTDWIVTDATGNRIVRSADFAEQFEEIEDE